MLLIISPSKTLHPSPPSHPTHTNPLFLKEAKILNQRLKKFSMQELSEFMGLSPKLAELNFHRIKNWSLPFTEKNSKPAIFTFQGDLYDSLNCSDFIASDLKYAQEHLRILSGLYGVLRPMDLIQPYRLEMGSSLKIGSSNNLYQFWGDKIAENLKRTLVKDSSLKPVLLNLASGEYFKSLGKRKLLPVLTINFKESKGDTFKVISFAAKKARGLMTRYIIKNRIISLEDIKSFDKEGYQYNSELSNEKEWIFTRKP